MMCRGGYKESSRRAPRNTSKTEIAEEGIVGSAAKTATRKEAIKNRIYGYVKESGDYFFLL
jgi:hypothetical protein